MTSLAENLKRVRDGVADAALAAGRDPASVRLLAVSKTFPASDVLEAYRAGQREFGENRVQELEVKVPALPKDIVWHLIGHLQSNKAAKAVELVSWIHSVDSAKLARRIGAAAAEQGRKIRILLEANTSGEESKFGLRSYADVLETAKAVLEFPALELKGLMTMAPAGAGPGTLHLTFSRLVEFRKALERDLGIPLPELSMGMSGDYPAATAEGATIVRIGTAVFGGRDYSNENQNR